MEADPLRALPRRLGEEAPIIRRAWPLPLGREAYHGLVGEFLELVEPHTESDSPALAFQLLAALGNALGGSRFFRVEKTDHAPNLYVSLVGDSSIGRKGTAWKRIRDLMGGVEPEWSRRIKGGLSSGEGLICHVRDAKGDDAGVEDKRLFIYQSEFASALRVMQREGNTLSPTLRQGWDGDELRTLTRNNPLEASGAHVALVGHITRDELRRRLAATEYTNGFVNRVLWVCSRRSKCLPMGGEMDTETENALIVVRLALRDAVKRAIESPKRLRFDSCAERLWCAEYERLTTPPLGAMGSIVSRAAPQVLRLSIIYAAIDEADFVGEPHLRAALECWAYAEASAHSIFGDFTGDVVADQVLRVLAAHGRMTRNGIHAALGGHTKSERLDDARDLLLDLGQLGVERIPTAGRPREEWWAK
jgi:hypothetical protein